MRYITSVLLAAGLLTACASNNDDGPGRQDLYLAVALETAVGTLISLEATGTLPPEGADFIDATLAYGGAACTILNTPELTPEDKRLALLGLHAERAAVDAAFGALVESEFDDNVRLAIVPAMSGARAAVRIALTEEIDPEKYAAPCETVKALATSWDAQRPGA